MGERCGLRQVVGVDGDDVVVGQMEAHRIIPDAVQLVLPVAGRIVVLHNQSNFGSRLARRIGRRPGISAGTDRAVFKFACRVRLESGADSRLDHGGRLIPRLEARDVHGLAVGTDCQTSRRVHKNIQDLEGRSTDRRIEIRRIEHPNIGSWNTWRGELRVARARYAGDRWIGALLSPMRGRDERPNWISGEDDIAGLISDQKRSDDVWCSH